MTSLEFAAVVAYLSAGLVLFMLVWKECVELGNTDFYCLKRGARIALRIAVLLLWPLFVVAWLIYFILTSAKDFVKAIIE